MYGYKFENTNICLGNGEKRRRNSGSLSDILASFPPPGLQTPEGRGSWPIFFGRSNLRNVEQLNSNDDEPNAPKRKKTCCGMSRKVFVILCIIIFIIVILAVLLPVFLVAVPREKANKDAACANSTPARMEALVSRVAVNAHVSARMAILARNAPLRMTVAVPLTPS